MCVRTYTVHTDKFSIEHTSVGLAHARPISIKPTSALPTVSKVLVGLIPANWFHKSIYFLEFSGGH